MELSNYIGKQIEFRKDAICDETKKEFKKGNREKIDRVVINNKLEGKGIIVIFDSGRKLSSKTVTSFKPWLKRQFRILL